MTWAANRGTNATSAYGPGVLFAAGLITGEALIGICMAIPIVATGNPDVLAISSDWPLSTITGLIVFAMVGAGLAKFARQKS